MNLHPVVDMVSVKTAAAAVQRDISRVYAWIREGRLTVWEDAQGRTFISLNEAREIEAIMFKRRNNRTTRRPRG